MGSKILKSGSIITSNESNENSESINSVELTFFWAWASNENPWTEDFINWVPYDENECKYLEVCYQKYLNGVKEEVLIGYYEINFDNFVQLDRTEFNRQRPIKRIAKEENFAPSRFSRYQKNLKQNFKKSQIKTINSLQYFKIFYYPQDVEVDFPIIKSHPLKIKIPKIYNVIDFHKIKNFKTFISLIKEEIETLSKLAKKQNIYKSIIHDINKDNFFSSIIKMYTKEGYLYNKMQEILYSSILNFYRIKYFYCSLIASFVFYSKQKNEIIKKNLSANNRIIVFRGGRISKTEIDQFIKGYNYLRIYNNFVSTSLDQDIAKKFLSKYNTNKKIDDDDFPCFYKIELDFEENERIPYFIPIFEISYFPLEKEILINGGSIGVFKKIEKINDVYYVEMMILPVSFNGYLKILKYDKKIKLLDLTSTKKYFDYQTINYLIDLLCSNKAISKLNLDRNFLGENEEQLKLIFETLKYGGSSINSLSLNSNELGKNPKYLKYILEYLTKNPNIQILFMDNNNFLQIQQSVQFLSDVMYQVRFLKEIHLRKNNLGINNEIEIISKGLKESLSLEIIDLAYNSIGLHSTKILFDALYQIDTLKCINLSWNKINDDGIKYIYPLLQKENLRDIDLSRNQINHEICKIKEFCSEKKNINYLYQTLEDNNDQFNSTFSWIYNPSQYFDNKNLSNLDIFESNNNKYWSNISRNDLSAKTEDNYEFEINYENYYSLIMKKIKKYKVEISDFYNRKEIFRIHNKKIYSLVDKNNKPFILKINKIIIEKNDKDLFSCKLLEIIDKRIYNYSKISHKYISSFIGLDYMVEEQEMIYKIKFFFLFESVYPKQLNLNDTKDYKITKLLRKLNEILVYLEYQNIKLSTLDSSQIFFAEKDKIRFLLFEDWEFEQEEEVKTNKVSDFISKLCESYYKSNKDETYNPEIQLYIDYVRKEYFPFSYLFLISNKLFPSLFNQFKPFNLDNQEIESIDNYDYPFLGREINKVQHKEKKYITIFYENLSFRDISFQYFKNYLLYLYFENKLIDIKVYSIKNEFLDVEIFIDDWFYRIESHDFLDSASLENFIIQSISYFWDLTKKLSPNNLSLNNFFYKTPQKNLAFFELYSENNIDTKTDYIRRLENLSKFGFMLKQFMEKFEIQDKLNTFSREILEKIIDKNNNYKVYNSLEDYKFKINSQKAILSLEKYHNIYDNPDICKELLKKYQHFNDNHEVDKLIIDTLKKISNSRDLLGINLKKNEIMRKGIKYLFDRSFKFLTVEYEYHEGMMIMDNDMVIRTINHQTMINTKLWENNIVYYTIDEEFKNIEHSKLGNYSKYCNCTTFSKNMYDITHEAIQEWNANLPIKFEPKEINTNFYHVKFTPIFDDICYSEGVGKMDYEGSQAICYHNVCYSPIWHEMGHVVGFFHEHQRLDRDLFVEVGRNCLKIPDYEFFHGLNYHDLLTYDYKSLMHYSSIQGELVAKYRADIQLGNNNFNNLFKYKIEILSGLNIDSKLCTYEINGNSYIKQKFFYCLDCMGDSKDNTFTCCGYCKDFCHSEHNIVEADNEYSSFCDCGSTNHIMKCTRISGGDQLFKQKLYVLNDSHNTYFICIPCYNYICIDLHKKNKKFKVKSTIYGRCNCPCLEIRGNSLNVSKKISLPYLSLQKNHSIIWEKNFQKLKKSYNLFEKFLNKFVFNICFIGQNNNFEIFYDSVSKELNKINVERYSIQINKKTIEDRNISFLKDKSVLFQFSEYNPLINNNKPKNLVYFDKKNDIYINVISIFVLEEKYKFKSMKKSYLKEIICKNANSNLESINLLKIIKILIKHPGQLIFNYSDNLSYDEIAKKIFNLVYINIQSVDEIK